MGDIIWSLYGTFIHSVCYKIKSNRHGKKKRKRGRKLGLAIRRKKQIIKAKLQINQILEIVEKDLNLIRTAMMKKV